MAPGKDERHRAILDVVRTRPIRTQEELVRALHERDHVATQATVSRDIRELGLMRVADGDGPRYVVGEPLDTVDGATGARRLVSVMRDHLQGVEFVEVVGVLRCRPSTAPLVAAAIDAARLVDVAGTVAGDDTVLVIARGRDAAARLGSRFSEAAGG